MSILDLMSEIEQEGMDMSKRPQGEFENLPDGTYNGYIEDFTFKTNDSGKEWFTFIVNMPDVNKKQFCSLFTTGAMAKQNLKTLIYDVYKLSGETLQAIIFADVTSAVAQIKQLVVGKQVVVTLKTSKNGFQNFEFEFEEVTPAAV